MRVCLTFLIQLVITIIVYSGTDSLFDYKGPEETNWSLSNLDLAASASTSFDDGDDGGGHINSAVLPDSSYGNDAISGVSSNANDVTMRDPLETMSAGEQGVEWLNAGDPCVSDMNIFQSYGKPRRMRRGETCRTGSPKAGEREGGETPSDGSSNSGPLEIPNAFTAPGGVSHGLFYPSENEDECPPSLYGPRKTPMCDSGLGEDFIRYSVLGFVALEMIEECLPCTYLKSC